MEVKRLLELEQHLMDESEMKAKPKAVMMGYYQEVATWQKDSEFEIGLTALKNSRHSHSRHILDR